MSWKFRIRLDKSVMHEETFRTRKEAETRVESAKREGFLIGLTGEWAECADCEWAQGNVHLEIVEE